MKADGYGHGAADVARAALEAARRRCASRPWARLSPSAPRTPTRASSSSGPAEDGEVALAREARLELTVVDERLPEGVPLHLKLDTGMDRWGLSELGEPRPTSSA